ncbi:MAG: hypothetical protein ACYC3F_17035 [Gemmatimonadaceae bacterium]
MARKNVQHPSVAGATGDWPIPHRKHPKKGWQSWNTPTADWWTNATRPTGPWKGDPVVSWEDTWCDPEEPG